jgi:hypothetical protein
MIWKYQKIIIWSKDKNKKNLNFFKSIFKTQKQTVLEVFFVFLSRVLPVMMYYWYLEL